ncbi:MAG: right-handed parallel beta-helix repeat-containing protein, partial [Planctomycetes bacterium]|nr:right-handed parallel beta-helix repeat-containing protein [Planctomycetota bacterium]
ADFPPAQPPPIPPPKGRVIKIDSEEDLQREVKSLRSDTTLLLAAGTYRLTNTVHLTGGVKNVALRGATGKRRDVVLLGRGMRVEAHGDVPHGIMVSDASDVLIADLSVGDVWFHPITIQGGAGKVRVWNVRMFEAGEQFLKSNRSADGKGVDAGEVEHCLFEYAESARSDYTNGVDVHAGKGWQIRNCVFRNIRAPDGQLAGPAVLMWNGSADTICENNVFVNCQRGIAFGLIDREGGPDHRGGRIAGNAFARTKDQPGDAGIMVFDSPGTKVAGNAVVCSGTYETPIEIRFKESQDVELSGNRVDGRVWERDGARAKENGTEKLSEAEASRVAEIVQRAAKACAER